MSPLGRTIAVDLVGHGKSGKPDIDYRFPTQRRYLEEFISVLGLTDLVLVAHDWGSGLGFAYASRHPDNVRAIFEEYARYLRTSPVPKLWLYATPGFLLPESKTDEIAGVLPNVEAIGVGPGLHFIQEDQPDAIGSAIADWLRRSGVATGRSARSKGPLGYSTTTPLQIRSTDQEG